MSLLKYSTEHTREFMDKVGEAESKAATKSLSYEDFINKLLEMAEVKEVRERTNMRVTTTSFYDPLTEEDKIIKVAPELKFMDKKIKDNQRILGEALEAVPESARAERRRLFFIDLFKNDVKEIVYDKPPTVVGLDGVERKIWFNKTRNGINIRTGFLDGDTNRPDPLVLADGPVHMMGGGITGSGKSVLINTWLATLMLEYPPHELRLWLADFKKVELSRYAKPIKAPHAHVVAATESPDYIITLFEDLKLECQRMQNILEAFGLQHIKEVESEYGFIIPRNLLLVDEFVQLFENIKDDPDAKSKVMQSISYIARIGRNAGYHMLLTSQSMGGVLSDDIAKQFKAGAALQSDAATSKEILGNDQATDIQGKGVAYVNDGADRSEKGNRMYQVPYISSDLSDREKEENSLIVRRMVTEPDNAKVLEGELIQTYLTDTLSKLRKVSDEYKDTHNLKYFDQDAVREWGEYEIGIDRIRPNVEAMYKNQRDVEQMFMLGDISMYREDVTVESYKMGSSSNQNIAVLVEDDDQMYYGMKLIYNNLSKLSPTDTVNYLVKSDIVTAERYLKEEHFNFTTIFREFPYAHYEDRVNSRREFSTMNAYLLDNKLPLTLKTIYYAQLEIGNEPYNEVVQKELLYFLNNKAGQSITTDIHNLDGLLSVTESYIEYNSLSDKDKETLTTLLSIAKSLLGLRDTQDKITSRSFVRQVYYVYGLDKEESIAGMNVDGQKLRHVFKDGTQYGVYVVFITKEKGGLNRISDSIGITLDRTTSLDILSTLGLKRHTYYGDHFLRFTKISKKETDTLIFKRYRLDMQKEIGEEDREDNVLDFTF